MFESEIAVYDSILTKKVIRLKVGLSGLIRLRQDGYYFISFKNKKQIALMKCLNCGKLLKQKKRRAYFCSES